MIGAAYVMLRTQGLGALLRAAARRLTGAANFNLVRAAVEGGVALEVGGPSGIFARRGLLPVYPLLDRVDHVNYAARTVWSREAEQVAQSGHFQARKPGRQFIAEATDFAEIETGAYDVLLSSHVLEHLANPLRALAEWIRVLRDGGHLVLVVPHGQGTFDHRRPVTTLRHLIEDRTANTGEDDLTHMAEILKLHDRSRDPAAGNEKAFLARCERNYENRCMHHHVFDTKLVSEIADHMKLEILALEAERPAHIILLARKSDAATHRDNASFLGPTAEYRVRSPFSWDRSR